MMTAMSRIDEIKQAVQELSADEVRALRDWLDELDEQLFDERIARDDASGKLDNVTNKALENLRAGRVRDL